jgi:hypothetical protein
MAKLTKTEINTLVNKIVRELNEPRIQEAERIQEALLKEKRKDKRHIDFCKLFDLEKDFEPREIEYKLRQAYYSLFKDNQYTADAPKKVSASQVEEEIILANIDCTDIEDLINRVKKKFN